MRRQWSRAGSSCVAIERAAHDRDRERAAHDGAALDRHVTPRGTVTASVSFTTPRPPRAVRRGERARCWPRTQAWPGSSGRLREVSPQRRLRTPPGLPLPPMAVAPPVVLATPALPAAGSYSPLRHRHPGCRCRRPSCAATTGKQSRRHRPEPQDCFRNRRP